MNENFDIHIIDFIKNEDSIEKVEDGHSGALLYKITRGKNKYFLKIFNNILDEDNIRRLKKQLEIYKYLNINSLYIIEYGSIKDLNKYYIVYNYIDGVNLKVYTDSDEYSLKDVRNIGKCIGKEILKLNMYEKYDKDLFFHKDIDSLTKEIINNFYLMLKDKEIYNVITNYFEIDELNTLRDKINQYANFVKSEKPKLIHGDIKRANIMIDNNKNFYIVDVESMQVNYHIINFLNQMTWTLFEGNEKETEFVKGYFDGIYNGTRPPNFNYNVIFITIINFFKCAYNFYKSLQNNKLIMYLEKCRMLFNKINQLDLNKEFII